MSDLKATVTQTKRGFHVEGFERITYDFDFVNGVFDIKNTGLADCYKPWKRVLAVMDKTVYGLYGQQMARYFEHHGIPLTVHKTCIGEKAKTMETLLSICDSITEFGIIRKEPVLVIGGGLVTDVAGFACATYRRNTNYIRIPTTVIGLIDASVSIKVAVNYGNYKNRLGAYHAPMQTFLDFSFLRTLPTAQVRNGFAELTKISSCAHIGTFDLLDHYCEQLIETKFGQAEGASDEIGLDRVIAYGHTYVHLAPMEEMCADGESWSPLHELIPETPLRHGHAISIDMAYSATLARQRGLLSPSEHSRLLALFSRAGLSIDHPLFDGSVLEKGTAAILKTRDGLLRLAVPSPLGRCTFINDVSDDELKSALSEHKKLCKNYPREGAGVEAYVDSSDTGVEMEHLESVRDKGKGVSWTDYHGVILGPSSNGSSTLTTLQVGHTALMAKVHGNSRYRYP
ncbi:hypothetical protein QBC46DRAFT_366009 [Diplogelasinospora grovesii]|uniref:2-epi-5-epi-valiolone synthase n=1 Tax=Diplogelasinospora grovesii TaxID=303347 RepID=A0AAN6N5H3_9PEZI|nr:hypothetical protein QBC46DRAFT_366009 [Diplogelasinospora grovesii]